MRIPLILSLTLSSILYSGCGPHKEPAKKPTKTHISYETHADINLAKQEPYYKYAWHLESNNSVLNEEGYTINAEADMNITAAWKITMGQTVRVAVIDDGGQVDHEDLNSTIYKAYNADDNSSNVYQQTSKGSHGNTCAGFIVAAINGKGVVGVAPKSKLILIRQEESSDAKTIQAFEYAKKHGAKVISCSWGTEYISDIVSSELKSLYQAGISVVFASGNDGKSLDTPYINDESEQAWVIGVGASTEFNDVSSYSNYGKAIDILAPGGDVEISSGLIGLNDMASTYNYKRQRALVKGSYQFVDGTSFAAPNVAGVIALMYSVNPEIKPKEIREILISTATKVGEGYDENGFETKRAYGKINAGKAVTEAQKRFKR